MDPIAVQVGDALKYSTSLNEIDRIAAAVLKVRRDAGSSNGQVFQNVAAVSMCMVTVLTGMRLLMKFYHPDAVAVNPRGIPARLRAALTPRPRPAGRSLPR